MINLQRIADMMNHRGIMNKSFFDMDKDEIMFLCKSIISSQEPGYMAINKELASCYMHGFWVVYRDKACLECEKKGDCPSWPTERTK